MVKIEPSATRLVIDSNNGNVLGELEPGDRIIKKSVVDRLPDNPDRMPFTNGAWGKTYSVALNKLARLDLTAADYKTILLFLTSVRYGSGLIAYGNYKPVNITWIENELHMSHKTVCRTIERLLDFRIISKSYSGKESIYFFNPFIYSKGRYINKTLFEMFRKSEWAKEEFEKR